MNKKHDQNKRLLNDPALIQGIADAAPGMLYVIDLRQMKMVYANQKVLALFGKTLEELGKLGAKLFDDFVFPEDRPQFDQHISELLAARQGEIKELTFRLLDSKREPTWVRTRRTVYKRDLEGNPTHIISVSQDVSEEIALQQIREELEEERRRLKEDRQLEIFKAILATQEEERWRLYESLHNGLGQLLYGVKLNLSTLGLENAATFLQTLNYAQDLLEEGIKETRRISYQLMPSVLHDFGIKAAIEDICRKLNSKILFSLEFSGLELLIPKYIELAMFRIIQELVYNMENHSQASTCRILLNIDEHQISIEVADNGIGFDPQGKHQHGIGLKSLSNKVALVKGEISIESGKDGSAIKIAIPHPNLIERNSHY